MSRRNQGYVVAVVATLLVTILRLAMHDLLREQALLLPFVLAVMPAAWLGGFRPGIAATALSLASGLLIVAPYTPWIELDFSHVLNAAFFVTAGTMISGLCEALHRAQRAESEKQFHTLANSIPQLVWMARPDGHRFWFNRQWHDYVGALENDERIWQSIHDPAELPRVQSSYQEAIASGTPWEEIVLLRRHDGQKRWHLARAVPVRDDAGQVVCWFGTNTDITERLEVEQTLKEADRRKDEFLATLAHELRNPLAPLSYALQSWRMGLHDAEELNQLRALMERQVEQITRLIDDLMDVSRITRGKLQLHRQPLDLNALVSAAADAIRPAIQCDEQRLCIQLEDSAPLVHGDSARLTQVFGNLLQNANKYTPREGHIWVAVSATAEEATVTIRDDGAGIPPDMLGEIFELFRQVDRTINRSHGGLGIGLTLVKRLVEIHGGTIEAHSAGPNQGSEFVVTLPTLTLISKALPGITGLAACEELPRRRILLVDDVEVSASMLANVLRSLGQDVSTSHDGLTALHRVLTDSPDIVLLDIAMPGMDGYEVARQIRAHRDLDNLVLIALTGYGQDEDRRRAYEAGFNYHMVKPATVDALRALLSKLPVRPMQSATVRGSAGTLACT